MGSFNPAAAAAASSAASSSGDWRPQLNPNARPRMRSIMLQTLRRYLPVEEVRRQNITTQIENQCYIASANQSDYFKNIAAVINHVKQYQKYRHPDPAPSLPQQGNNRAHSSASILMSQQQSQQPDNSTLVQAASLSSDDQSWTGDSQTSALYNTSGQSTIGQMHRIAIQSATQSGIQHNPLNTVQQPVNQQQQHPEPSMNQQFSVQRIELTQQSLQQPATGELSNLHPNQPNNLLNQHQTQVLSQPQHLNHATSYNEDGLWQQTERTQPPNNPLQQLVTGELSILHPNQLNNLLNHHQTQAFKPSQPQHLNHATLYNEDGLWHNPQPLLGNFEFSEEDDTFSISEYLHDQEMNIGDEEDGCFDSTGLANSVFMTNRPTNPKKRKCDGSSSGPVL